SEQAADASESTANTTTAPCRARNSSVSGGVARMTRTAKGRVTPCAPSQVKKKPPFSNNPSRLRRARSDAPYLPTVWATRPLATKEVDPGGWRGRPLVLDQSSFSLSARPRIWCLAQTFSQVFPLEGRCCNGTEMIIEQFAAEALRLEPKARAVLAESLWESLTDPFEETQ